MYTTAGLMRLRRPTRKEVLMSLIDPITLYKMKTYLEDPMEWDAIYMITSEPKGEILRINMYN